MDWNRVRLKVPEANRPQGAYANLDELIRIRFMARDFSFQPQQPVDSILSGRYASRLRGRGLNFEELRRYLPGDDIRAMDWKVTARTRSPHVRVYSKEPSPFADDDAGLVMLLKVSSTMKATDVQPSRIARAKHKLRDLLEARKGLSTGLVVYSGSAHLLMPLTRDDRIVTAIAEDLTPELMPADGDALAEALLLAGQVLQRAGVPGSVLVMADSVAPAQADLISTATPALPVLNIGARRLRHPR